MKALARVLLGLSIAGAASPPTTRRCARSKPAARGSIRASTSASSACRSAARSCCRRSRARRGAICCRIRCASGARKSPPKPARAGRARAAVANVGTPRCATRPAANGSRRCSPNSVSRASRARRAGNASSAGSRRSSRTARTTTKRAGSRNGRGSSRPARASRALITYAGYAMVRRAGAVRHLVGAARRRAAGRRAARRAARPSPAAEWRRRLHARRRGCGAARRAPRHVAAVVRRGADARAAAAGRRWPHGAPRSRGAPSSIRPTNATSCARVGATAEAVRYADGTPADDDARRHGGDGQSAARKIRHARGRR